MKNRDGLENNDNWKTPDWLYKIFNDEFNFDFDPFPLNHDLKLWSAYDIEWKERNWVNPPYNRIDKPKAIKKGL